MHTKTGHSLWPPLCGALAIALVVLLVLVLTHDSDSTAAPATSATATAVPSSTVTIESRVPRPGGPVFGDSPTGCLAGTSVDADMVLRTQAAAPHTSYGAVEVAASYARWSDRYPFPDAAQIKTIQDNVISSTMPPDKADIAAAYALVEREPKYQKNIPPGPAEFGTHHTTSTRPGKWLIDSTSTSDRVTVHLMLSVVINGVVSNEIYGNGSPVLAWENGAWRLADMVPISAVIKDSGTAFTEGC